MARQFLVLIIISAILSSCRGTKSTTEATERDRDSTSVEVRVVDSVVTKIVHDTTFIRVTDPTASDVVLDNPCDSLTGLLREFEIKAGRTTVTSTGNSISVTTGCDSVTEVYKQKEMSLLRTVQRLQDTVAKLKESSVKETSVEKTGFIGWVQKLGISFWTIVGTSIFWLVVFFILKVTGKI